MTSRLGTVLVAPAPLVFTEPTSIELEPAGTLLLVENNPGRLLRVDPATGRVTALVPAMTRPYSVVRAPMGDFFVSTESRVERIGQSGARTTVVDAGTDVGPLAVSPAGDVYYATATQVFRLAGGSGGSGSRAPVSRAAAGTAGRRSTPSSRRRTASRSQPTVRCSSPTPAMDVSGESIPRAA